MLLLELALLLLISSTLSSAESFAYLFGLYIFVKIARSWLKGKYLPYNNMMCYTHTQNHWSVAVNKVYDIIIIGSK